MNNPWSWLLSKKIDWSKTNYWSCRDLTLTRVPEGWRASLHKDWANGETPETAFDNLWDFQRFQRVVHSKIADLGPPKTGGDGCCPLGLHQRAPRPRPTPGAASLSTGFPLPYCRGVIQGWEGWVSFFHQTDIQDSLFMRGFRFGKRLRTLQLARKR